MAADGLRASRDKMRADGADPLAIEAFAHYYRRAADGERGTLAESELDPVEAVAAADELPAPTDAERSALDRTVVIKVNGGLGTSMGMTAAKSLIAVKDGLSFLDVIVRQVLALRRASSARLPLVLMNSFYTREDSLAALGRYPDLPVDVPLDFLQGRVPKLRAEDLEPVAWAADARLEWAPPGHGDIYTSLVGSGMLDALLDAGYEYAFVSNADNLGAVLDERILAWFVSERIPFLMEVAERSEADRKGGHIARVRDRGLVLREVAQTDEQDLDAFQDIRRHRFFNTNTLWMSLASLKGVLEERDNILGLPMIVNRKTVDPSDPSSPAVVQLETAMGAAIAAFEGARAVRVGRRRFAPVKTTNDLLALRSDAYALTPEQRVELAPERSGRAPLVDLDECYFKLLRDFDERFPAGPPSLIDCARLVVSGDVRFGRDVRVHGSVTVDGAVADGPLSIADGTLLEGPRAA